MDIISTPEFESFQVTDYYFAYLGTNIFLSVRDGVDEVSEEEVFGRKAIVITTVEPAERNVLFVEGMQGVKVVNRVQRKVVPPVGSPQRRVTSAKGLVKEPA